MLTTEHLRGMLRGKYGSIVIEDDDMSVKQLHTKFPAFKLQVVKTSGGNIVNLHILAGPIEPKWTTDAHRKYRYQPVWSDYTLDNDMENYILRCIKEELVSLYAADSHLIYFGKDSTNGYVFDDSYYK